MKGFNNFLNCPFWIFASFCFLLVLSLKTSRFTVCFGTRLFLIVLFYTFLIAILNLSYSRWVFALFIDILLVWVFVYIAFTPCHFVWSHYFLWAFLFFDFYYLFAFCFSLPGWIQRFLCVLDCLGFSDFFLVFNNASAGGYYWRVSPSYQQATRLKISWNKVSFVLFS